jgi:hypothetical protein
MSMISRQSKTQPRPVILTIIADVKLPRMLPSSLSFYPVPILNGEKKRYSVGGGIPSLTLRILLRWLESDIPAGPRPST